MSVSDTDMTASDTDMAASDIDMTVSDHMSNTEIVTTIWKRLEFWQLCFHNSHSRHLVYCKVRRYIVLTGC